MFTIKKKRTRPYNKLRRTLPLNGHRAFLITTFRNLCPFEDGSSLESWIQDLFHYVHLSDKKVRKYHVDKWIKNKPWITDFEVNERPSVQNEGGQGDIVFSATDVVPTSSIGGDSQSTQEASSSQSSIANNNQGGENHQEAQQQQLQVPPVPNQTPNSIQLADTGLALIDTLIDNCKTLNIPSHNVQLRPLYQKFQHLIKNPQSDEPETSNFDELALNNIKQEPREDGQ